MLDSRYIHLHDALGLGAMWLKQGAKIIGQPETAAKPKISNQNNARRLALLQKINAEKSAAVPKVEVQPIETVDDYLTKLSGSIPRVKVMALCECPSLADVVAGKLFSGEDGVLLQKMFNAINLNLNDIYISAWLKDAPHFGSRMPIETICATAPRVAAEWQLSGADTLILMGDFFEREEVKSHLPESKTFFIPHPQRILENTALKRAAWETLQQLDQYLQLHRA